MDTEFDGGVYHGRIILPAEYPMKPPNIIILTVSKWSFVLGVCMHFVKYDAGIMVLKNLILIYSLNTADNQLDDVNAAVEILSQMPALKWRDVRVNPFTKKPR